MNVKKVVEELKEKYPGKNVVVNDEDGAEEVICEVEPASEHPERSLAVAVVGKIKPHKHKKSKEIYEVIKGELTLYVDGEKKVLKEGERAEITPETVHWAESDEAWFKVYSTPGWTLDDHIVVESEK